MAHVACINDGNYDNELEIGRDLKFPFADKGDNDSFEVDIKYIRDKDAFRKVSSMSVLDTQLGRGYMVDHSNAVDQGNNLYEYHRIYASLPANRIEGASVTLNQQWWKVQTSGANEGKYFYSVDYDLEEQSFTVDGEIEYEYFLFTRPGPLLRYRAFLLFGRLRLIGGAFASVSPIGGTRIVTEDSEVGIYKGKIFYRKTSYAILK